MMARQMPASGEPVKMPRAEADRIAKDAASDIGAAICLLNDARQKLERIPANGLAEDVASAKAAVLPLLMRANKLVSTHQVGATADAGASQD